MQNPPGEGPAQDCIAFVREHPSLAWGKKEKFGVKIVARELKGGNIGHCFRISLVEDEQPSDPESEIKCEEKDEGAAEAGCEAAVFVKMGERLYKKAKMDNLDDFLSLDRAETEAQGMEEFSRLVGHDTRICPELLAYAIESEKSFLVSSFEEGYTPFQELLGDALYEQNAPGLESLNVVCENLARTIGCVHGKTHEAVVSAERANSLAEKFPADGPALSKLLDLTFDFTIDVLSNPCDPVKKGIISDRRVNLLQKALRDAQVDTLSLVGALDRKYQITSSLGRVLTHGDLSINTLCRVKTGEPDFRLVDFEMTSYVQAGRDMGTLFNAFFVYNGALSLMSHASAARKALADMILKSWRAYEGALRKQLEAAAVDSTLTQRIVADSMQGTLRCLCGDAIAVLLRFDDFVPLRRDGLGSDEMLLRQLRDVAELCRILLRYERGEYNDIHPLSIEEIASALLDHHG